MISPLRWCVAAVCVTVAGCSSGVVPAGPQTYILSRSVTGFSSGAMGKAALYREANEWCEKRGLVMVPVASDAIDPVAGRHMGSAELTFRALSPGDPRITAANIEKPDYTERVKMR